MVWMKRIPFVPLPLEKAVKLGRPFFFISEKISKLNPSLEVKLIQAGIKLNGREYLGVAIFSSLFWFLIFFLLFASIGKIANVKNFLILSLSFSLFFSIVSYLYITLYPGLVVIRKLKDIERNLLFAIRHLFIQVRSGVSLFDAMVSVARGNYGLVSKEFERCTKEIAAGKDEIRALEDLGFRNPSTYFRRTVWQITNALRAGGDVGKALEIIANNLSEEQRVKIRKYGSELSPLALMYLMFTIIIPTLGITFLIIFSTFTGISIPQTLFILILGILSIFQFMFIGMIKNRRPSVEV